VRQAGSGGAQVACFQTGRQQAGKRTNPGRRARAASNATAGYTTDRKESIDRWRHGRERLLQSTPRRFSKKKHQTVRWRHARGRSRVLHATRTWPSLCAHGAAAVNVATVFSPTSVTFGFRE